MKERISGPTAVLGFTASLFGVASLNALGPRLEQAYINSGIPNILTSAGNAVDQLQNGIANTFNAATNAVDVASCSADVLGMMVNAPGINEALAAYQIAPPEVQSAINIVAFGAGLLTIAGFISLSGLIRVGPHRVDFECPGEGLHIHPFGRSTKPHIPIGPHTTLGDLKRMGVSKGDAMQILSQLPRAIKKAANLTQSAKK